MGGEEITGRAVMKYQQAFQIFTNLKFDTLTTLGRCARHEFPSGWGVSVLRLGNNRWTSHYEHGYEVMLTHNGKLCHDYDTPLTYGDSVRFDDAASVIKLLDEARRLTPKEVE